MSTLPTPEQRQRGPDSLMDRLQSHYGVRFLWASEGGSAARGLAGPDANFNIRAIYVGPSGEPKTIITPVYGGWIEVRAWELRKALGHLAEGNTDLIAWLRSPIVYREVTPVATRMRELIPACFRREVARYRYGRLTERLFRKKLVGRPEVKHRTYTYVLGAALARRWVEAQDEPVPLDFETLMRATLHEPDALAAAEELVAQMRAGTCPEAAPPIPELHALLEAEVTGFDEAAALAACPPPPELPVEELVALAAG